jgi:DNA-binding response OmpR family regulator
MEGKRVLIVEDELNVVMVLCRALLHPMAGGYQVEVCPRAASALKRLRYEQFDLVITDMRMPGMNGLELIRQVRQTNPEKCMMLITAFGSPELETQVRRLGVVYLPKPFSLQEFVATVQGIFDKEAINGREERLAAEEELGAVIC